MHNHLGYFQQSAETDAETKYSHVGNEAFQQHAYSGVQKPRVESKQGVRSPVIISLVFRIPATTIGTFHLPLLKTALRWRLRN
jgi:hypothetical protein